MMRDFRAILKVEVHCQEVEASGGVNSENSPAEPQGGANDPESLLDQYIKDLGADTAF